MRVLAAGVFDLIHPGHVLFLEKAKRLGDELVVIVSRDETAKKNKRPPVIPEKQRLEVVEALKPVDKAMLGDPDDLMGLLPKLKPDIIALGFDQDVDEGWLEEELERLGMETRVVRLKDSLKGNLYSTRRIIDKIKKGA